MVLSEIDVDTLYNVCGCKVSKDFLQQVVKVNNYDVDKTVKFLVEFAEKNLGMTLDATEMHQKLSMPKSTGAIPKKRTPKKRSVGNKKLRFLPSNVQGLIAQIKTGVKIVVLLRGPSGSGKSTLAHTIFEETVGEIYGASPDNFICSADHYFTRNGIYRFQRDRLSEAHEQCQLKFRKLAQAGFSPILVDNTNINIEDMRFYVTHALKNGYLIVILTPATPWARNVNELARLCVHQVPVETIRRQLQGIQGELCAEKLISLLEIEIPRDVCVPQLRKFPELVSQNETAKSEECEEVSETPEKQVESNENEVVKSVEKDSESLIEWADEWVEKKTDTKINATPLPPRNKPSLLDEPISEPPPTPPKDSFLGSFQSFFSILNKIQPETHQNPPLPQQVPTADLLKPTRDTFTNTSASDFQLIENPSNDCRVIQTSNRNINENYVPNHEAPPPVKLMLDKGSLTDFEESTGGLEELIAIFPGISKKYLKHILKQCQGQVGWAVDILLETPNAGFDVEDGSSDEEPEKHQVEDRESTSVSVEQPVETPKNELSEEEKLLLKKQVEQQFVIDDSHYSAHCLKIRNKRHNAATAEEDDSSEEDYHSCDGSDDSEDCTELNIGFDCISALTEKMGLSELHLPEGLKPVISVPNSLIEQLHSLWLESYYQQISAHEKKVEQAFKEDEKFALQLHESENGHASIQDVLTMQIDLEFAKRVQAEELGTDKYEDLATRMSQQKLFEMFPDIPQDTICEVLNTFDNKFDKVVELLSGNEERSESELLQATQHVSSEVKQMQTNIRAARAPLEHNRPAEDYRSIASTHYRLQKHFTEKSHLMQQRGFVKGADVYAQLAEVCREEFSYANTCAATCIWAGLTERSSANGRSLFQLDLHGMFVREAMQVLDIFIDFHIQQLKQGGKNSTKLFLITGRGNNSKDNVPKIKFATKKRLKQRLLKVSSLNEGLLKTVVNRNSLLTENVTELPKNRNDAGLPLPKALTLGDYVQ